MARNMATTAAHKKVKKKWRAASAAGWGAPLSSPLFDQGCQMFPHTIYQNGKIYQIATT
jgi:hypothetical protein